MSVSRCLYLPSSASLSGRLFVLRMRSLEKRPGLSLATPAHHPAPVVAHKGDLVTEAVNAEMLHQEDHALQVQVRSR